MRVVANSIMAMTSQLSGTRSLSKVAGDYVRGEVTALWVHEQASKRHILAFVVAELCPREQEPSALIQGSVDKKTGRPASMMRRELGPGRTAYVSRLLLSDPHGAVDFYRGREGRWTLPEPLQQVHLEALAPLEEEPPFEVPILVASTGGSEPLGRVLPRRHGSLRVYSRLEPQGLLRKFLLPREMEVLGGLAREILGVDLLHYTEYQSAILLCAPNPLLRDVNEWLTSDDRHLVAELLAREGCSVEGCTVEVTDLRASGDGFRLRSPVTEPLLMIPIPSRPWATRTRIYDPAGDCIHESTGVFPRQDNFRMDIEMGGRSRQIKVELRDGATEQHEIKTVAASRAPHPSEKNEQTVSQLLRKAQEQRELRMLEEHRTFVYFEGGADSRRRAAGLVQELLGRVRRRCIICDPYLSADDVARFAPFVPVQHLPIRLLGARFFLRKKIKKGSEETEGDVLMTCMRKLIAQDQTLVLSCRVLRGHQKSSVHDRFLVMDDDAYLLGSSLNEFGSRATTLFKVPHPARVISEIESWWSDTARSFPLEELGVQPREPEEDDEDAG